MLSFPSTHFDSRFTNVNKSWDRNIAGMRNSHFLFLWCSVWYRHTCLTRLCLAPCFASNGWNSSVCWCFSLMLSVSDQIVVVPVYVFSFFFFFFWKCRHYCWWLLWLPGACSARLSGSLNAVENWGGWCVKGSQWMSPLIHFLIKQPALCLSHGLYLSPRSVLWADVAHA